MKNKKEILIFLAVMAVFFLLRLPAVHSPYHQDEYKWVQYSHPEIFPPGTVPHPPLTEFIYTRFGPQVGDDNFRLIPLAFGFLNLFLIFYLAKTIFDKRTALWTAFLFAVSFYSVLASLMVDVDGAVMPFFFLLMAIGYFKLKSLNFEIRKKNLKWLALLLFGATGGFLVKVVFFLPIAVLALDFVIERKIFSDKKKLFKYFLWASGGVALLITVLYLSKFVFPFFNLEYAFGYWKHFAVFGGRHWLQTFIQFMKALLYASPILLVPVFLSGRETIKKARAFLLLAFIGTIFYLFAFDFSMGALDRYFEFLVIPLSVISGAVIGSAFGLNEDGAKKKNTIIFIFFATVIFLVQFLNHATFSLYPKTEWFNRMMSLKLNFLFPFAGGSGPIPFYISFLFITLIWAACLLFIFSYFGKILSKKTAILGILVFGLVYNGVFIEEHLFGKINGSSPKLVRETTDFIKNNNEIKNVVVYNDNGGWEIRKTGKYSRRMYAAPQFEESYREFLKDFAGHILFINIPKIEQNSFYEKYINSCREIYSAKSGSISAKVCDCRETGD